MDRGKEKWESPPLGFIKLNYDGVSKGNLGQAGARGLFIYSIGNIMYVYSIQLGLNSNNG